MQPERLAHQTFDSVAPDGVPDFFGDGHTHTPHGGCVFSLEGEKHKGTGKQFAARPITTREVGPLPEPAGSQAVTPKAACDLWRGDGAEFRDPQGCSCGHGSRGIFDASRGSADMFFSSKCSLLRYERNLIPVSAPPVKRPPAGVRRPALHFFPTRFGLSLQKHMRGEKPLSAALILRAVPAEKSTGIKYLQLCRGHGIMGE